MPLEGRGGRKEAALPRVPPPFLELLGLLPPFDLFFGLCFVLMLPLLLRVPASSDEERARRTVEVEVEVDEDRLLLLLLLLLLSY
jgi:hypothetical protein